MKSSATPLYRTSIVVGEDENSKTMRPAGVPSGKMAVEQPKKLERKSTEDVNASAEAFIQKFRQQLLLQRLESIENYEQMLKRGT